MELERAKMDLNLIESRKNIELSRLEVEHEIEKNLLADKISELELRVAEERVEKQRLMEILSQNQSSPLLILFQKQPQLIPIEIYQKQLKLEKCPRLRV